VTSLSISTQIATYEAAITIEDKASNYWWLGIAYLLSGNHEEAQATWFLPFINCDDEIEATKLNTDLGETLLLAAKEQTLAKNFREALLLREQYQELGTSNLENILELILLSECCGQLHPESIVEWGLKNALATTSFKSINTELLSAAFGKMLSVITTDNIEQILYCIDYHQNPDELIDLIITGSAQGKYCIHTLLWVNIFEYCHHISPSHLGPLHYLSIICCGLNDFNKSIITAEKYLELCVDDLDKIFGYYLLIRALMEASDFNQVAKIIEKYRYLLNKVLDDVPPEIVDYSQVIVATPAFFAYLQDTPRENRHYLNRAGKVYQECLHNKKYSSQIIKTESTPKKQLKKIIRIGYIAGTLYSHSVGWLCRWLWKYHNHSEFQVFTYFVKGDSSDLFTQKWFQEKSDSSYYSDANIANIINQIKQDQIDILIDLDSLTDTVTYEVMAHKPAPVQATWLGWDASGCAAIDYFIADPYVLPNNAQEYYNEKIWRLPETYVAVDGFEIGIPSIQRSDFGIGLNDIVYFSAQKGYKLNEENVVAQMKIIKGVPNSHLLVKARGDRNTLERMYYPLTEQVGIDLSRIHFLGTDPDELTHRANLQIADVVLDTFPYNGATTTLETLWLGIPIVTKVGEQFAARNAYSFMINAGINEGIANNVDEYIDWGIKLGNDSDLRKEIHNKLRMGRKTSPLWNGARFTKQMEEAYQEMWKIYECSISEDFK
jgi:predicted O-linked N-acetylglucosamine transferase (SPINDLY family)